MVRRKARPKESRLTARKVRERIESQGERFWRFEDFQGLPVTAVAQALSRAAKAGALKRLSKGVYYRARPTALGESRPNPTAMGRLAASKKTVFPAGVAAAGVLGFTTQTPGRSEVATSGFTLPRKLLGSGTVIHTRRPDAWAGLSEMDAALLGFLRERGRTSELSPTNTVQRTLALCRERGRFARLLKVAGTEPPRARAMLGAIGTTLRQPASALKPLRESLNPASRFDFGVLVGLPHAEQWQARIGGRTR